MKESTLARNALKYLNSLPRSLFFKYHGNPMARAGVSDLIGCLGGRFVAIELKIGNNKLTPIQQHFLTQMALAGAVAGVAYDLDDIKNIVEVATVPA